MDIRRFKLLCLTAVLTAGTAAGCGKKGALLYPDSLVPAAVSEMSACQSGQSMKISFLLPEKEISGRPLQQLKEVRLYRSSIAVDDVRRMCSECGVDDRLLATVYPGAADEQVQHYGRRVVLYDSEVTPASGYRYSAVAIAHDGGEGKRSRPVSAVVESPLPPPGVMLRPVPTELLLEITAPDASQERPVGYNIYRALRGGRDQFLPLNATPLTDLRYRDSGLERHTEYRYRVRGVYRRHDGCLLESLPSAEVSGRLREELE